MYTSWKKKTYDFFQHTKPLFAIIPYGQRFTWKPSDKLGNGAFGEVFKARDKQTGKMVAVKEINWTKKTKNTIIRETEILSRMHHKNIAELVQAFRRSKKSQKVYIAMELCPGGELFDAISDNGHLTEEITKKVIHEVLEALVYCHGLSVAHLDLKPENIILSRQWTGPPTPFPSIKLIDWGLASEFKDFRSCPDTCLLKGTPDYIAPEVFTNEYTEKADLWSVGVIIFVMLQGAFPFDPMPVDGTGHRIEDPRTGRPVLNVPNAEAVSGLSILDGYSDLLKTFLRRLITLNPDNRPSAVESLQDPWFASASTAVVDPLVARKLTKLIKKNRF
jgi:serine/threonine protein kinase